MRKFCLTFSNEMDRSSRAPPFYRNSELARSLVHLHICRHLKGPRSRATGNFVDNWGLRFSRRGRLDSHPSAAHAAGEKPWGREAAVLSTQWCALLEFVGEGNRMSGHVLEGCGCYPTHQQSSRLCPRRMETNPETFLFWSV